MYILKRYQSLDRPVKLRYNCTLNIVLSSRSEGRTFVIIGRDGHECYDELGRMVCETISLRIYLLFVLVVHIEIVTDYVVFVEYKTTAMFTSY